MRSLILFCLDGSGKQLWKRLYWFPEGSGGRSITVAKNKDFIIAGFRYVNPFILRTDTLGNIKWSTWLYDSVNNRQTILKRASATFNSVRETKRGTIICAAGDNFTDGNYIFGNIKYDYAAVLSFDSSGKVIDWGECGGVAGYSAGGFCIEETASQYLLLSGNQEIFYFDNGIGLTWKKKYTFNLDGVGAEVNNITRCKTLRDGSLVVAGMAYEGNCWTNFGKLYYDAWWSPISYSGGTNSAWDTAGFQGGNDAIYDFTQLSNGNIVFIGSRANGPGGIWTFVTDSTGKKLLWEKQNPIPYKSNPGSSARGYSVCATDDGGFTVAGELVLVDSLGGHNALAAHFVSKPVSAVVSRIYSSLKSVNGFNVRIMGEKLVVSGKTPGMAIGEVALFDVSGRCVAMPSRRGERLFALVVRYFETGAGNLLNPAEIGKWCSINENRILIV